MINTRGDRNTAIYLTKKLTPLPNRQIGDLLGGLSSAGVVKTYQRFSAKITKDRSIRKRVKNNGVKPTLLTAW